LARFFPPRTADEFKSQAERTLYNEFRKQLSDDYVVLHSVAWRSRKGNHMQDGEADFVIGHPKNGVLLIEVKGGAITRDGMSGDWFSRDGKGETFQIKDPFEQASRNMYSLRDMLTETVSTSGHAYPISRAVAFPEVLVNDTHLGPEAPREMVIDSADLATLGRALLRAWGTSKQPGPGDAAIADLVRALRPPIELSKPGLLGSIRVEEAQLFELTQQQVRILEAMGSYRRAAFAGTAGSGKTMLAIEEARSLAAEGKRVLFTCFNRALGEVVERTLKDEVVSGASIVVDSYHDLAERYACEAGISLPTNLTSTEQSIYYSETLPELFLEAIEKLGLQFDAIVVDEGQDFADIWWVTLEALLPNCEDGILYVFYDENQRLFDQHGQVPIPLPHMRLTRNCRNTRAIHDCACSYLTSGTKVTCDAPIGRTPVHVPVQPGEEITALKAVLHDLTNAEGIPLDEIVLLTPRSERTSLYKEGARIGNVELTWHEGGPNRLRCRSIASYKGLESPVVILAEPDRAHTGKEKVHLHVGLTRAQYHLVVLGTLPDPETIT